MNRRRWLVAGATAAAGVAGVMLLPRLWRAPARVVWRRVREKGFNVESWQDIGGRQTGYGDGFIR